MFISKKIFSRTSRPISIKLGINHPWVQGILNCSNKGPGRLQSGDNHKNGVESFKNLLQNHWARISHIYMKAFKKEIYWQCDLMAIKKSNVACVHRRNISQYDSGERCDPWASCSWYYLCNTCSTNNLTLWPWILTYVFCPWDRRWRGTLFLSCLSFCPSVIHQKL
jgi:hypothetical protein